MPWCYVKRSLLVQHVSLTRRSHRFNPGPQLARYGMPSWYGNPCRVTGPLWGESTLTGGFPSQKDQYCAAWCFFNRLLNNESSCRWSDTLWRSCDVTVTSLRHSQTDDESEHYCQREDHVEQKDVDAHARSLERKKNTLNILGKGFNETDRVA